MAEAGAKAAVAALKDATPDQVQEGRLAARCGCTGHALCFDRRPSARLVDEERPVRRALVVLPPRHMTAALRHRQSRSARLRGQLRPSDDRLASDRWARSLSGPSPACRSPVRLAARGPLACSPPPPRVPAPPRFPVHLTALELRTDGALWQTEQRPPRRSLLRPVRIRPPARAAAAAAAAPPGARVS